MEFILQVKVEAGNLKQAVAKIPDEIGEVLSGGQRPTIGRPVVDPKASSQSLGR